MRLLVFALMTILIVYLILLTRASSTSLVDYNISKLVRYSGFAPELYIGFVNNIELMKNNIGNVYLADLYLKKAIEFLREFIIHVPEYRGDTIPMIASYYEDIILKQAIETKQSFSPMYLNNSL